MGALNMYSYVIGLCSHLVDRIVVDGTGGIRARSGDVEKVRRARDYGVSLPRGVFPPDPPYERDS